MKSDLNDIWLQIIIDNGEDCKKTLAAKYEAVSERVESVAKALKVRKSQGAHLASIAALWSLMDEQAPETKDKCEIPLVQKARSQ